MEVIFCFKNVFTSTVFIGVKTVLLLFLHNNLQFNIFSPTFSSRFDELRGDFLFFQKFFQKHPPRIVSHFKQVKGLLIFFSKYPHFFDLRFKQVKGQIFSKKFLKNRSIWVCILIPFVQMSERSFFYGKIIKEI